MRLYSPILLVVLLFTLCGTLSAQAVEDSDAVHPPTPGIDRLTDTPGVDEAKGKQEGHWNRQMEGARIQKIIHQGPDHPKSETPELVKDEIPGICPQPRYTAKAPEPVYNRTNPLEPTAENLRAGKLLFKIDARPTACKVCHGFDGDGMGIIYERLTPKPRNFTCYYTMEDIPDGQMYWIIKNGSPGTAMPSFGYLSDKEVWQLILYIREFANKKK